MANNVQFIGIQKVLAAYEARDIECWSIWCGKEFHMKGSGTDELSSYLNMIAECQTTATYTLKIYEDITDLKQIKSTTPHDGSFNFKVCSNEAGQMGIIQRHYGTPQVTDIIMERLGKIEEHFLNPPEPEDKGFTLGGFIQEVVSDPVQFQQYINIIKGIINPQPEPGYTRQIGNVSRMGQNPSGSAAPAAGDQENLSQVNLSEDQLIKIGNSIDVIATVDKNITEHFEKLATIAKNKPDQFKMLLMMLDQF